DPERRDGPLLDELSHRLDEVLSPVAQRAAEIVEPFADLARCLADAGAFLSHRVVVPHRNGSSASCSQTVCRSRAAEKPLPSARSAPEPARAKQTLPTPATRVFPSGAPTYRRRRASPARCVQAFHARWPSAPFLRTLETLLRAKRRQRPCTLDHEMLSNRMPTSAGDVAPDELEDLATSSVA